MARTVKTVKDENNNDIEVYADNCNKCSAEMFFPKKQADEIEAIFPFIKTKIDAGTPCLKCTQDLLKEGKFSIYTDEEMSLIRDYLLNKKKPNLMDTETVE